jgi:acetoin utilization protein AcuB
MTKLTLREFMSRSPKTIGAEQTLATAHALMRKHRIRHLPVLRGRALVGLVSERDLLFVETIPGIDVDRVRVEEAMTEPVITLSSATSLEWVATEMAQHKLGSVVIMDDGVIGGVFTTIDALRALQTLLARGRRRPKPEARQPQTGANP